MGVESWGGLSFHTVISGLIWHLPRYLLPQLCVPRVHWLKRGHWFLLVTIGGSGLWLDKWIWLLDMINEPYSMWQAASTLLPTSTLIPVHTVRRPCTMIICGDALGVLERRREAFCDPLLSLNNWPSFGMSWQSKKVYYSSFLFSLIK